ncbi:BspA family leucine-rich repeat surface protein [Ekhidna sp.]
MNKKYLFIFFLGCISLLPLRAQESNPFITEWSTSSDGQDITIQLNRTRRYDFTFEWKDANDSTVASGVHTKLDGDFTTTLSTAGTYTLSISGIFSHLFNYPKNQLLDVLNWGDIQWESFEGSFSEWPGEMFSATDAPDLTQVTDMSSMFANATSFNSDLSDWDVKNVADMNSMFRKASKFNQNISSWDVSRVTDMSQMFENTSSFNTPINDWNVKNVTTLLRMFEGAGTFNQDLSNWDVSSVTDMRRVFRNTGNFNGAISNWNVENVTSMGGLFSGASSFNQNLSNWKVSNVELMKGLFSNSGLSSANYDQILIGWAALEILQENVLLEAPDIKFCSGAEARERLINDHGWIINDAGKIPFCDEFVTEWSLIAGQALIIPLNPDFAYNFNYEWRDVNGRITASGTHTSLDGDFTTVFSAAGTYTLSISGAFPHFRDYPKDQLLDVVQWGNIVWGSFEESFEGWPGTGFSATDVPNLTQVTNMFVAFRDAVNFSTDLSRWDVSNVQNMSGMFSRAPLFNSDLSGWNVSSATNMAFMFFQSVSFNSDLSAWDVSNVTDMNQMFVEITYSPDLSLWDVSNVTNMVSMFQRASLFNSDISGWNVSSVTNMNRMFTDATNFNGDLSGWNVSNVTNMSRMLENSGLSIENYDALLIAWSQQDVQEGVNLGASSLFFCEGEEAKNVLTNDKNWIITGDERFCTIDIRNFTIAGQFGSTVINAANFEIDVLLPKGADRSALTPFFILFDGSTSVPASEESQSFVNPVTYTVTAADGASQAWTVRVDNFKSFITSWSATAGESITIGLNGNLSYDFTYTWKNVEGAELTSGTHTSADGAFVTDFIETGEFTLEVEGAFPHFQDYPKDQLLDVKQWGDVVWESFKESFRSWGGEKFTAKDVPDLNQVTDFFGLFQGASSFNGDLSGWDVSNVTNMERTFRFALAFNQDISGWNTTNVTTMNRMFVNANVFNQDISGWDISSVGNMSNMLNGSGITTDTYDKILIGWSQQEVRSGVIFGASGRSYCEAGAARTVLDDNFGWSITDAGKFPFCNEFITEWSISREQEITIEINSAFDYDFEYEWKDASGITTASGAHKLSDGDFTTAFSAAGSYTLAIRGAFPHFRYDHANNQDLVDVLNWGDIPWENFAGSFYLWSGESFSATDVPDLSRTTNLFLTFAGATNFNGDLSNWDVSNITNMSGTFGDATSYNNNGKDLHSWDVSNVTNMSSLFAGASSFNRRIDAWEVSNVTNMSSMFEGATAYNNDGIDLRPWNVSNVTDMGSMFKDATSFNRRVDQWNVSNVQDMSSMFAGASKFNRNVDSWNAAKVTDMSSMFEGARSFNNNSLELTDWNVSKVTNMSRMFFGATSFNVKVKKWDVSKVTDMSHMFAGATTFNRSLKKWNVRKVTNMSSMFEGASDFNGNFDNLNDWDVSSVTNMSSMFKNATSFDQEINAWDVSKVTNMSSMFENATSFNEKLKAWDVNKVTDMSHMFRGIISFNRNIKLWDVSNVTNMSGMFRNADNFSSDLNDWDVSNVTDMSDMFRSIGVMSMRIDEWDVRNVTNMRSMFEGVEIRHKTDVRNWEVSSLKNMSRIFHGTTFVANIYDLDVFDQDLSNWDVSGLEAGAGTGADEAFNFSNISRTNYDKLLIGWAAQENLNAGVLLGARTVEFCSGADAREQLISEYGWIIDDGGRRGSCNSSRSSETQNASARTAEETATEETLEVEDELAEASLLIYPNPTSDVLSIQSAEAVSIYLTDLAGKTIISEVTGKNLKLDMSTVKSGTYLLYIQDGAELRVKRIIKPE